MDGAYLNDKEVLKSVQIINKFVASEESLLDNIANNLIYGFNDAYNSNNANRLTSSCRNLKGHINTVVSNNKKIVGTLNDVCILYKDIAFREKIKLQNARRDI